MEINLKHWWTSLPSKGGISGAILGIFFAASSQGEDEKDLRKAGRTAVYAGAGFLAGCLVEKLFRKNKNHQ